MFVRSELKQRNYKGWYIKLLRASEGLEATASEATEEETEEKLEALGGTAREDKGLAKCENLGGASPRSEGLAKLSLYRRL